jgi:hypothetical protein
VLQLQNYAAVLLLLRPANTLQHVLHNGQDSCQTAMLPHSVLCACQMEGLYCRHALVLQLLLVGSCCFKNLACCCCLVAGDSLI